MRSYLLLVTTTVLCLFMASCGGKPKLPKSGLDQVEPFLSEGPYAAVLKDCATVTQTKRSCRLSTLPPIGLDTENPTLDDILARVLVSRPWMGVRFEQLMEQMPEDMYRLMRGVTAIVIGENIRPSYYTTMTGAIYLDAANLWLTQAEKSVISRAPDYRSEFSDPMAFRSFWRYTRGDEDAYRHYGLSSTTDRQLTDIIIPMASLLFHELAHANDLFPPSVYESVDTNQRFAAMANSIASERLSTHLTVNNGLESNEMFHLASILFRGSTPTSSDKQTTATAVGGFFEPDKASDDYAYSSQFEDLAMLFEEAMMKHHFGIDRDIAFVTAPAHATHCDDYRIGWGVRNRIGTNRVKARAEWVTQALLPGSDYSDFFEQLPAPQYLEQGRGWCSSQNLNSPLYYRAMQPRREYPDWRLEHMERPYHLFD